MSNIQEEVLANQVYSSGFGEKHSLPIPPGKAVAILTCMDARVDPAEFSGLNLGTTHIIRNAGGRVSDDAIRSLVLSFELLGTCEWFVIRHTDCGITNEIIGELPANSLEPEAREGGKWKEEGSASGSMAANYVDCLTIRNPEKSLLEDVIRIKRHPLVPARIQVYGYVYEVETRKLIEVPEATEAGASIDASECC